MMSTILRLLIAVLCGGHLSAQTSSSSSKSYWEDLTDGSIDLYENEDNPWLQRIRLKGRLHVQGARVQGQDARNREFSRKFNEYRRARIEADIDLKDYLSLEISAELVEDNRFRGTSRHTGFGYQNLSDATLNVDLEDALDWDWIDDFDVQVGRQKVGIGFERDLSSNEILTIERSALADRLSGENQRPTGVLLEVEQGDVAVSFGYFSTSPAEALARWEGDGFYYARIQHEPAKDWIWFWDGVQTETNGPGLGLTGYAWSSTFNVVHERDRYGFAATVAYGDNGCARHGNDRPRRQGNFRGAVIMPWFWLKTDYLQVVLQGQWQESSESEGIRLDSRYVRQIDDMPGLDVENGYGNQHRSVYLGLNYHPWGGDTRLMIGVSHDHLATVRDPVEALTQWAALRAVF